MNTDRTKSKRNYRRRSKRDSLKKPIITLLIFFSVALLLLLLNNWSVRLNEDIRNLQSDLDFVTSQIDSKNGQIMSSADLKAIESEARALGMTEADPSQYVYETAARKQSVITDSPVGLYDYLEFFQQVRNERLWPLNL